MSESAAEVPFELLPTEASLAGPAPVRAIRRLNPWLAAAFLIHAAILTGFVHARPRELGDANGASNDDAISVSLVTESELRGDATVADSAAGEPAAPPAPQEQAAQPPPSPPAAEPEAAVSETPPPAPPDAAASEAVDAWKTEAAPEPVPELRGTEPAPKPADAKPSKPAEKAEPSPKAEKQHTSPAKPAEAKPAPAKAKPTQTAKLDLAMPPPMSAAPAGSRGAGIERPPGITRSGENDDFARGVIRALQQTMPQLSNTRGRVRVRITLNKNGNLVSTEVLMPSNIAGLDQSVVFATRQTSFPFPPFNANSADLVFVVTYIYR